MVFSAVVNWNARFSEYSPGGYSREFWIGVCREGSWTLTLFKELIPFLRPKAEKWDPIQGKN